MIAVAIAFLIPIFDIQKWNLDRSAFELTRMEDNYEPKKCSDCYNLTLKDTFKMFNGNSFLVYTDTPTWDTPCRMYNMTLKIISTS